MPQPDAPARPDLCLTLLQPDVAWEDADANLAHYTDLIAAEAARQRLEVVLLPELFATGFSMATEKIAEPMDGRTVAWMREAARRHRCIVGGSVAIREADGRCYNRFVWMQPDGVAHHYDKRHLFAYGGEDRHYTRGERRVIVRVRGWKICLQVCYDLRFPVWSRNAPRPPEGGDGATSASGDQCCYDVLVYIAAWPERRAAAWNALLPARAIENQAYAVGLNRVGEDGKGIAHRGDSAVYGPDGAALWKAPEGEAVHTVRLSCAALEDFRAQFRFLDDADRFLLL